MHSDESLRRFIASKRLLMVMGNKRVLRATCGQRFPQLSKCGGLRVLSRQPHRKASLKFYAAGPGPGPGPGRRAVAHLSVISATTRGCMPGRMPEKVHGPPRTGTCRPRVSCEPTHNQPPDRTSPPRERRDDVPANTGVANRGSVLGESHAVCPQSKDMDFFPG